jgi:hypothetical protein
MHDRSEATQLRQDSKSDRAFLYYVAFFIAVQVLGAVVIAIQVA